MRDDNPFTPGFGQQPPYLAGRDGLLAAAVEALRSGPGRTDYHRFIIGARGTGKTVTLGAMASAAAERGAVIVRWTAGSRSLADALGTAEHDAQRALQSRWRRSGTRVQTSATVGMPGVVSASASTRSAAASSDLSSFGRLERLARQAAKRDRTLVVWVDEAQLATQQEIAALAAVMQELANVQRLPIALWAAGLPDARPRWIDAASSLERQSFTTFENLGPSDTAAAFDIPIREAGHHIDDDLLAELVASSGGYPYIIQLIGAETWDAADGHDIDRAAVDAGTVRAVATLQEQIYVARWRQMSTAARDYLAAAAEVEDEVTGLVSSTQTAALLGLTTKQLSMRRELLIVTHQVLSSPGRGQLTFTQPGMAAWVRAQRHRNSRRADETPA